MRIDHTRTDAAKARAKALRNARRISSARKFLGLAFETSGPAPSVFA